MTPVYQSQFGMPLGNCLAACVATILDVPLADVPASAGGARARDLDDYLAGWGLLQVGVRLPDGRPRPVYDGCHPDDLAVFGGPSPRGDWLHAVVGRTWRDRDWEYVHDPHPDGGFFGDRQPVDVTWLVPIRRPDPAPAHKYVVFPHEFRSEHDGDHHRLSAGRLARLYGVPPGDCVVWDGREFTRGGAHLSTFQAVRPGVTILRPSSHGDYDPERQQTVSLANVGRIRGDFLAARLPLLGGEGGAA